VTADSSKGLKAAVVLSLDDADKVLGAESSPNPSVGPDENLPPALPR